MKYISKKYSALVFAGAFLALVVVAVSKHNSTQAMISSLEDTKTYSHVDSTFNLSFDYPKNWFYQERKTGASTPFSVVVSDQDIDNLDESYPDKLVNVVFYKTDQSPADYAATDFAAKHMASPAVAVERGSNGDVSTYLGNFKDGKYISAYKRSGDYLVIIESYVKNPKDLPVVQTVFSNVVRSIKN